MKGRSTEKAGAAFLQLRRCIVHEGPGPEVCDKPVTGEVTIDIGPEVDGAIVVPSIRFQRIPVCAEHLERMAPGTQLSVKVAE